MDGKGSTRGADGFTDNLVKVRVASVAEISGIWSWESEDARRIKSTFAMDNADV